MADIRTRLRQAHDDIVPPPDVMGTLIGRRKRLERRKRDQRRKIASVIVGIAVLAAGIGVVVHEMAQPGTTQVESDDQIPAILPGGRLSPGPHQLSLAGIRITFTVPEGWRGSDQGVVDSELGADAPAGAGLAFWTVSNVYTDPCEWKSSARRPPVGSSVGDLAAALATQKGHPAGDRIKTTINGFDATQLEMTVPADLDMSSCSNGEFHTWQSSEGDRFQQGPGQIDRLWLVNVHGVRIVIDASYFATTSQEDRQQVLEMCRSVQFS
jgi:hypothetical protein